MGSPGAGLCDTCYSQDIEAQRRAWERENQHWGGRYPFLQQSTGLGRPEMEGHVSSWWFRATENLTDIGPQLILTRILENSSVANRKIIQTLNDAGGMVASMILSKTKAHLASTTSGK